MKKARTKKYIFRSCKTQDERERERVTKKRPSNNSFIHIKSISIQDPSQKKNDT